MQCIGQPAMIIAGIGYAADDRDRNTVKAERTVQRIHGTDQAGCIAAGKLQVIGPDTFFVIGISVEKHIRHRMFFSPP